ncbi:LOW QUALITY PROTEIN: cytochrome P450 2F3-like [Pomacea canaliculata]|uniref:LOW QUALITY PROTEIN: cytochrome P450 2F3-like n=1 Tax=Pomacea canaliculata TaxID=400727 RepID=UPI000D733B1D|nr:LOW QUALITY PROTEIN: cytochrome P450 2F3-like [Pomacea canaliculata]
MFKMNGTQLLPEMTSVLLLVVLALVSLWWLLTRRPVGVPPGPGFALPVLGHLHLLKSDPRQQFTTWRRQYGDVFSLYMGSQLVVVLNGYKVIKDALVKHADAFSDRPHFPIAEYLKSTGVIESSGPIWKAQRKTALEILRGFGFGKNILAERIQEEVTEYLKAIAEKKGQPQEPGPDDQVSVSNNICSIVFGKRFEYDDPVFNSYMHTLEENAREAGSASIVQTFPFLRFIPGDPFGVRKLFESFARILNTFVKPFIERHIEDYDENCVDDFISAYLREIEKVKQQPAAEFINKRNLGKLVFDLFGAGTETTSTSIRWIIALLLHHPEVQDKCYEEIHRVVGTERVPTIHDRPAMVYLEATILEVLRYADIVPLSLPHCTASHVELSGYTIPKGTFVLPNLESVLHDPETWGDPENFRPERFIGQDGTLLRFEEHIPFSIGRRVCLGEAVARMELFLYLAAMIQRFRFLLPETGELPSLQGTLGIAHAPKHFMVRVVVRELQTQTMFGIEFVPETTSFLLLVVLALVSLWWLSTRRPAGLPPGPGFALPVLGHMHLLKLKSDPRQLFAAWRRQYGDVFSLYVGSRLVVVLNGYKSLAWEKTFWLRKIQEEVKEYINALAEKKGQPQDLARITQVSVSNNICSIVFGKRFEYEDPVFKRYIQALDENIQAAGTTSVFQTFPALRRLPGDPFGIRRIFENVILMLNTLIKPFIDRHVKDYDENSVDDFISAYLREIAKAQQKPTAEFINEINLRKVVFDLFGAGTETTSTSIRWTIAYFLHHPDVQDRCYEEIHRVVGTERAPTIRDRTQLVYLEATILEVLRYSSIVPFSVPHSTATRVEFSGYTIPKGTTIIPNLHSVLHAPEIWGDPDVFRPERFITNDDKLLRFDELIPFSIGRRVCLARHWRGWSCTCTWPP